MISFAQIPNRKFFNRLFFGLIGLLFIYFYFNNLFLSQLESPVLVYPDADNIYWLALFLKIPQSLTSSSILAYCWDIGMVLLLVMSFVWYNKNLFPILFIATYTIYFITFNTYACHHYHNIGVFLVVLPFCFKRSSFNLIFEFCRYYICFIYFSAACFKLFRGSVFNAEQMTEILRSTHLLSLAEGKEGLISFLLSNPIVALSSFVIAAILSRSFSMSVSYLKIKVLISINLL